MDGWGEGVGPASGEREASEREKSKDTEGTPTQKKFFFENLARASRREEGVSICNYQGRAKGGKREFMSTRNSMNGGEWSPEMSVRADLDAYPRGCKRLENWELSPEGGIKRRGGLEALGEVGLLQDAEPGKDSARVFAYVYTQEEGRGGRYVVVVDRLTAELETTVTVYKPSGEVEAALSGGRADEVGEAWRVWLPEMRGLRAKQVNALLFFMSPNQRPWVLKRGEDGNWELEEWKFKQMPWRYTPGEDREQALILRTGRNAGSEVVRRGAWYTASDSERQGGEEITVPSTFSLPRGATEHVIGEETSGNLKLTLFYGWPTPQPTMPLTFTPQSNTRSLYANSGAKSEIESALEGSGIRAPLAQNVSVPWRARATEIARTYTMSLGLRIQAPLPIGSNLTLYLICEGALQVEGLSDASLLWAEESGEGFTRASSPGGAGRLHLLRVTGKLTGEEVRLRGLGYFMWCGARASTPTYTRNFALDFSQVTETGEGEPEEPGAPEDHLRASYWTEQREARASQAELLDGVTTESSVYDQLYTAGAAIAAGSKLAFLEHPAADCPEEIYSCTADFNTDSLYVNGMDSPANYPGNFIKSTRQSVPSGETPIRVHSLKEATGTITKGKYVALVMQGWKYYTVRKPIAAGHVFPQGPENSPDYFAKGLMCGEPLPCRGAWSTYTSGVWYGEYAVKRNFDTTDPLGEGWETAGRTASRIGSPANKIISGDENDEECHLSLWLLGSRCMDGGQADLSAGFPGDSCENRLIVESYRRDLHFILQAQDDGSMTWVAEGGKLPEWEGEKRIMDWSWWAFSPRYGGPTSCEVYAQRLVFAGTHGQPQTLWLSKTDDIDNFQMGANDADAMELTLATTSQNPICWLQAKGDILLLGTSECEYSISSRAGGIFTSSTVVARPQSYIGSATAPCIQADNRVLFLQRGRQRLYEIGYDFETDGYLSRDLSLMASHIGREHQGLLRGGLSKVPYTTAYIVLGDGQLALLAYNPLENIKGWHRWHSDNGPFTDVCVLPGDDGADQIYLLQTQLVQYTPLLRFWQVCLVAYNPDLHQDQHISGRAASTYSSEMTTLPLNNILTQAADKQNSASVKICLGAACNGGLQLSKDDGEHYFPPDRTYPLAAGWHDLKAPGGWRAGASITIKSASATEGLHILALQS